MMDIVPSKAILSNPMDGANDELESEVLLAVALLVGIL